MKSKKASYPIWKNHIEFANLLGRANLLDFSLIWRMTSSYKRVSLRKWSIVATYLFAGHKFSTPEYINKCHDAGITSGYVKDDTIIRARGLPWQVSDCDVADFFVGLNICRWDIFTSRYISDLILKIFTNNL